jgi:hypothetical protein
MSEHPPIENPSLENENRVLKQRIDELERIISSGNGGVRAGSSPVKIDIRQRLKIWLKIILFTAVLAVAAIPSYLVLRDRWLEHYVNISFVNELWWKIVFLRQFPLPRYFLAIFAATLLSAVLVFLWRGGPVLVLSNLTLGDGTTPLINVQAWQQKTARILLACSAGLILISATVMILARRIPGIELLLALLLLIAGLVLREYPIEDIKALLERRGRFWLDAALFFLAVCLALYGAFGITKPDAIYLVVLILTGVNFARHWRVTPPIFWVSVAALIALTWKINGWEYTVIGDEYSFFEVRMHMANMTIRELLNNTFNGTFVYGSHPYFSSYIQYVFMLLFDNHNFGWRFSNPFLVACSLFFFYSFFKSFLSQRTALITVILLGFSHYLMSFTKIGYNNPQALFAMGLVLAATAWALKTRRVIAFSLLGLCIGLCFYVYPAALYLIPLPFFALLIFYPPWKKGALKNWLLVILAAAVLIYPLIIQAKYWETKIPGTFITSEVSASTGSLAKNILINIFYAFYSYLYTIQQTHFVSTGYIDPLSGVFFITGMAYLFKQIARMNKSAIFLAGSFLFMLVIVGATHGREFPTTTRMFMLLPWFAVFTAFGLEWYLDKASNLFTVKQSSLLVIAILCIIAVNLYQAYRINIRNTAQYQAVEAMFLKTAREINVRPDIQPKSYVFIGPPDWGIDGLRMLQRAYQVPDSPTQLAYLPLDGDRIPVTAETILLDNNTVVLVLANMAPERIASVDASLAGLGRAMCEIKNMAGNVQFQLWHTGDLGWLCP